MKSLQQLFREAFEKEMIKLVVQYSMGTRISLEELDAEIAMRRRRFTNHMELTDGSYWKLQVADHFLNHNQSYVEIP